MMEDDIVSQLDRNMVEGARQLEQKKTQLFGRRDFVMDLIALVVVFGFFGMAFLIAVTPRDNSDHDVLNMLIGQLSAGFIAVLSFFFGNVRKP
jgi:hypothetical protein